MTRVFTSINDLQPAEIRELYDRFGYNSTLDVGDGSVHLARCCLAESSRAGEYKKGHGERGSSNYRHHSQTTFREAEPERTARRSVPITLTE